ncbi:hypothetical protein BK133_10665 [Paenibacillus sp. FSL H8-0548]|uniref:DUF3939 domain-containing protein n=1 Tax=Paenibacillus sp. FSL H8-0548 TaxID=1920422 RepID=UPI000970117D|nr:DUF3939 domain-containing protein [Paenibacillus sp. FSL H8-0548]OMF35169.1 hypothetical protein BK133_10665 [Paenibacillus sp. FSL H8-0548]
MKNLFRLRAGGQRRYLSSSAALVALFVMMLTLSGCMYPKDQLKQNQVAPKDAIRNVQAAIDQYQEETSMLPIKNSTAETPKYEKFYIDFAKLSRTGYLTDIPTSAFENGGNYSYLVIDEETKPTVKLLDIITFQKINDIQGWVRAYIQTNSVLPKGEEMYPGFYQIDYKSMNKTAPVIRSVFSGQTLQAIVDENGVVYTDYGIDIMQFVQKNENIAIDAETDLRSLLVDKSDYVPVKAPLYRLVNEEPQAVQP